MDDTKEAAFCFLLIVFLHGGERYYHTSLCKEETDAFECRELLDWMELLSEKVIVLQLVIELCLACTIRSAVHSMCSIE